MKKHFLKAVKNKDVKEKIGFDVVGNIAIVEIPEELRKQEKEIAKNIAETQPHIKTVCKKNSERLGEYRLWKLKVIFGPKKTETIHSEYGCKYKVDVAKVYFSPREGTERQRIANQVKKGEHVMVMFSGVAPFAIAIAKKHPDANVYAVEINSHGHRYAKENVKLNHVTALVTPILGDVRKKCVPYFGKCDRVIMPLPKDAHLFLNVAIKCLKPEGGIIHFYHWAPEDNPFEDAIDLLKDAVLAEDDRKIKILNKHKVLPYGPRMYKICIDAYIKSN